MNDIQHEPAPDLSAVGAALSEAFAVFAAEMAKVGAAFSQTMTAFWATPDGQYLRAVVEHFKEHPELLGAAREAQRVRYCDCFCQRWGHLGACNPTAASTSRVFVTPELGAVDVPLCTACAADIDRQRGAGPR